MKNPVMLEYCFIFDATNTYQHMYQFEQDLAKCFAEHGMEAQILAPIGGYQGRKVMLIVKKEELPLPTEKPPKPGSIQKQINKLRGGKK